MSAVKNNVTTTPRDLQKSRLVVGLTCVGLIASTWLVRPSDPWQIQGWLGSLWFVAAWSIPIVASLGRAYSAAIGALVVLFASQIWFYVTFVDAMVLAIKPFYEIPLSAFGGWVGYLIENSRKRQAEEASAKRPK